MVETPASRPYVLMIPNSAPECDCSGCTNRDMESRTYTERMQIEEAHREHSGLI